MDHQADREILLTLLRAGSLKAVTPEQWQAVARLAHGHQVAPYLYRNLISRGVAAQLPPDILEDLHAAYLLTAAQNARRYHELNLLVGRFERAHIPVILLKGAHLADAIYGDIAARPMGDADLLVRRSDLARVVEIMPELEYIRMDQLTELIKEYHCFEYEHARSRLAVEIHWALISPAYHIHEDLQALWERSQEARVADIPVRILSPEDQVLLLCLHASQHVFEIGLRPICDLHETLRFYQGSLDWECLRQRARDWNAERCLYVNLRLASELFEARLPEGWLHASLPPGFDPGYLATAREHLFASVADPQEALLAEAHFVEFWKAASLAKKLRLLWESLFRSRQIMAMDYHLPPGSLRLFLYYPVHWKDLLQRYGRLGWQLLRRDRQTLRRAEGREKVNVLKSWLFSE
jgi:hypothetical protein